MKTRSAAWIANQGATASAMSRISGFVEFRESDTIASQLNSQNSATLANNINQVSGQALNLDNCVVQEMVFMLSGVGDDILPYTYDMVIWTYDPVTHQIGTLVGSGQHVRDDRLSFAKQECIFKFADTYSLAAGWYAFLLIHPATGTVTKYHAQGNPTASGVQIGATTRTAGTVMTEYANEDMYFRLMAPRPRRWNFDNGATIGNVVEASIQGGFDPSGATLPINSCSVKIENAKYASDASKVTEYDFTDPVNYAELSNPGTVALDVGFQYDTGTVETVPVTKQNITRASVSKDDLYVTFEGESFTSFLDKRTFYGGWYLDSGISAATLFAEILDDVEFPDEGKWAYRIGDADCKVHAASAKPLWERDTYTYYTIHPDLASVLVYVPIPPVTHREALTMLAAYAGAYIFCYRDGSIHIAPSLSAPADYHIDTARVYDRPDIIQGGRVGTVVSALHAYTYPKGLTLETIADDIVIQTPDTSTKMFRIIHDPCNGDALTLTGATLVGSPTYKTYSTEFMATPGGTSFTAKLEGYPVAITSSQFERTYQYKRGERVEFQCPIASDLTRASAMLDRFHAYDSATKYRFTMRDDPALGEADRVKLDLLGEPSGIDVVVIEARRTFNGGLDCEYTVVADPYA